jgi:hypothetical protein
MEIRNKRQKSTFVLVNIFWKEIHDRETDEKVITKNNKKNNSNERLSVLYLHFKKSI